MKFFTLGGKQFWEDVFYYQKWRIQRHYRTKKYRLLDKWDICRATGSFEECRQAFVQMVEVFEIPRQTGSLVILLHGLGQNKSIFRPLWRALENEGYQVAAINYPSTRKSMKAHVDQLDFFLTHVEDIDEVSFITYKTGCLLLRHLLNTSYQWTTKFNIGKIININPTNTGSDFCNIASNFGLFRFIFGPMLKECTPFKAKRIPKLPTGIPFGIVFCETLKDRILKPIIKRYEGIKIPGDLTEEDFSLNYTHLKNKHLNVFDNPKLQEKCIQFLKQGKF